MQLNCKWCASLTIWILLVPFIVCEAPRILSFSPEHEEAKWENGKLTIPANANVKLHVYGVQVSEFSDIAFAKSNGSFDSRCDDARMTNPFQLTYSSAHVGYADVFLDDSDSSGISFYLCAKRKSLNNTSETHWYYQGVGLSESLFLSYKYSLMPLWLQISLITFLFVLSGLFSGLNLGLMSLSITELKIIENAGRPNEKSYAKKIRPVRARGNFLLCTLLLGNVLVNNTLAILMDNLTGSGLYAVVASTIGIVLFGEIIPQAVCSRHGLAIGAYTIWITKIFMVLTFPMSFPISLILDRLLGEDFGQVYSREKLGELIREQGHMGNMKEDEINIITGALCLTTKTVRDVMTPLQDAYMLSYDAILDFDTMNEIVSHGFTRIPVYENEKTSIRSVLNVKDLAFIDPDDQVPVRTVCTFYKRSIIIVDEAIKLDRMLDDFRQGKTHMAFVERLVTDGDGDPYREMIGLVTLEDVIEEIIQAEIVDETDIITDNVRRQRRTVRHQDFSVFNVPDSGKYPRLPPQLKVAALQHLSCNFESFKDDFISTTILQSFLNANIVVNHTFKPNDPEANTIYKAGELANFAVFLLQGRASVEVSSEKLFFEAGPFMFLGETVLQRVNTALAEFDTPIDINSAAAKGTFKPDYTVAAMCNMQYLKITAAHYALARRLTHMYQRAANENSTNSGAGHPSGRGSIWGPGSARPSFSVTCTDRVPSLFQIEWDRTFGNGNNTNAVEAPASLDGRDNQFVVVTIDEKEGKPPSEGDSLLANSHNDTNGDRTEPTTGPRDVNPGDNESSVC